MAPCSSLQRVGHVLVLQSAPLRGSPQRPLAVWQAGSDGFTGNFIEPEVSSSTIRLGFDDLALIDFSDGRLRDREGLHRLEVVRLTGGRERASDDANGEGAQKGQLGAHTVLSSSGGYRHPRLQGFFQQNGAEE